MFKLFKNLNKKDIFCIFLCILFIVFQVWLDLKIPDYMSAITRLVQTEGSKMSEILTQGGYMLLCAGLSLIAAIIVGTLLHMFHLHFLKMFVVNYLIRHLILV